MNEARAKATSKDGDEGVHRLRDIVVEEVSLVDRAANQRRFLVVKRSAEMADKNGAGAEGASDERTDADKAKKKPGDEVVDEEKAKKPADDEEDDSDDAEKARGAKDADDATDDKAPDKKKQQKASDGLIIAASVKDALLGVLTQALERLMALASSIKDATEPDDDDDATMPDDVSSELAAIAEMLSSVDEEKKTKADVTKAGARMAKDRLDRFQKALTLLADILKELTGGSDSTDEADAKPTAGAAESDVKKRAGTLSPPPATPGLAELASGIGELTRVVKRQEEELTRMRQARGVSNAIPVEGGRRAEPQDVSWPLDMNRPISRDKVRKEVSFFEE